MTPDVSVPRAAVFADTFFGVSSSLEPQAATVDIRRVADKAATSERTRVIGLGLPYRRLGASAPKGPAVSPRCAPGGDVTGPIRYGQARPTSPVTSYELMA